MYDITRYSSLKNFDEWLRVVEQGMKGEESEIPILMVGSKLDLDHQRAVPSEDAMELAKSKGLFGYVECSSKTGQNVEEIFTELTHEMLQRAGLL